MKYFYIINILLFLLSCNSKNSKTSSASENSDTLSRYLHKEYPNSIYIGMVTGDVADSFNKHGYYTPDSLFQLSSLIKSNKAIELRFFTTNYWSDDSYCILLSYDTSFSITGIKHTYEYDTTIITTRPDTARKSILTKTQLNCNLDTLFAKLVQNGVFSLNNLSNTDYPEFSTYKGFSQKSRLKNFPILELTKKGFIDAGITMLVSDGVAYTLEYKVDSLFDLVSINNPGTHFNHNPDFPLNRRRYEISELFLSCLRGVE